MDAGLRRGIRHALAASAAFAVMAAFAKAAAQAGASNLLLVFTRNLVCVAALLPWVAKHGWTGVRTERLGGHLWRSGFGLAGMATLYYALAHLTLAEALLLNYASPLFIPFIAWMVLGEKPPSILLPASLLGLAGVALIVKPTGITTSFAALVGLASGFFAACAMVSLRRISDTEPAARVVLYFGGVGLLVTLPPVLLLETGWPSPALLALLAGTGLFATVGQLQLTRAYAAAPAGRVAAFGYSAVIFAGLIGWGVWGEAPDRWSLAGAALVIGTCVLAARGTVRDTKAIPEDAAS
jgi:drug/metabolite transporter (DMT)-like permease